MTEIVQLMGPAEVSLYAADFCHVQRCFDVLPLGSDRSSALLCSCFFL